MSSSRSGSTPPGSRARLRLRSPCGSGHWGCSGRDGSSSPSPPRSPPAWNRKGPSGDAPAARNTPCLSRRSGGSAASPGRSCVLVVGQVAVALVLLLGAGLLLRSMQRLLTTPLGIRPERVLTLRLRLPRERYEQDRQRAAFVADLVARANTLPGVERAAMTSTVPLTNYNLGLIFRVEGQPFLPPGESPSSAVLAITPDYFATVGATLLGGRAFRETDTAGAPPVVIAQSQFRNAVLRGCGSHRQAAAARRYRGQRGLDDGGRSSRGHAATGTARAAAAGGVPSRIARRLRRMRAC